MEPSSDSGPLRADLRRPPAAPRTEALAAHEREARDFAALKLVLVSFSFLLVTNVVFSWIRIYGTKERDDETTPSRILTAVAYAIDLAVILTAGWRLRRAPAVSVASTTMKRDRQVAWGVVFAAVLFGANCLYHLILRKIFGIHRDPTDRFHSPVYGVFFTCLFPALMEEYFFRHLCLGVFLRFTDFGVAAFSTSVMFAAAHTHGLVSFPYLFLFGMCAAGLRRSTGSLLAPIVMHFTHNLLVTFDVFPRL